MAVRNYHVIVNVVNSAGRVLRTESHTLNAATRTGSGGEEQFDPATAQTVLSSNGKIPGGHTLQIAGYSNLDAPNVPGGVLS